MFHSGCKENTLFIPDQSEKLGGINKVFSLHSYGTSKRRIESIKCFFA